MYALNRISQRLIRSVHSNTLRKCYFIAGETQSIKIGCANDQELQISTGRLAKLADGAAVAQMGDTSVLVTAIGAKTASPVGFLPLTVDYREKAAAAGRIPTNHLRKELGPTEKDILAGRTIDRSLRPMFKAGYMNETQLVCNILAVDGVIDPDVVAINAASTALCLSDIPFDGPVGAVRVGLIDGEVLVNPTRYQMAQSSLDLIVAGIEHGKIVMLEASANNVCLQDIMKAIKIGMKEVTKIVGEIRKFVTHHGKPKRSLDLFTPPAEVCSMSEELALAKVTEIFSDWNHDKFSRDDALAKVREDALQTLKENFPNVDQMLLSEALAMVVKSAFRRVVLDGDARIDGREVEAMRKIFCDVDLFDPLHGSAIFQRGQTQVLCTVTFDSPYSALRIQDVVSRLATGREEKSFMLHYEFPPYATNSIGQTGGRPSRRELGHGNLAERALQPLIPDGFPFTIRLTSEVLESNGSSSMATVCGGSLALLDAGVELLHPAAGVALGLVSEPDPENPKQFKRYKILTDILGIEDYLGEMDFKMAGTSKGITALQADVKIPGLPQRVVMETIMQGMAAKSNILTIMQETIEKARPERKDNWPVIEKFEVPPQKRHQFIGLGGRNLQKITIKTGVTLIPGDDNIFQVFAPNQTAMSEAKELMTSILMQSNEPTLDFGGVYTAKIVELCNAGVMVQLYPAMHPALLPNSQLDQRKVQHPSALGLEVGQEIQVKYYGRDPVSGAMRLSRKVLQSPPSSILKNFIKAP